MVEISFSTENRPCPDKTNCSRGATHEEDVMLQSGDRLLVHVHFGWANWSSGDNETSGMVAKSPLMVYRVTKDGLAACQVQGGVLLDSLIIEEEEDGGGNLITFAEEDLLEGANYFLVTIKGEDACFQLQVTMKYENCGDLQDCSGKGICYSNSSMETFECQCCEGYIGSHCEEKDACYMNPCQNSGICVDISQGHEDSTFQCLCPYGYTGKTCEHATNPCDSSPCHNGATCSDNSTHFRCTCAPGYTGPLCEQNVDECASSPCVHGICVDQEDGFQCFCQPGFGGQHCEKEYNECSSSPCVNGGTCTDHIGNYRCICGRGYTGTRCHIKIDLCDPDPCLPRRQCIDRGNNYSCECAPGYTGTDCSTPSRDACNPSPCMNGGTCWTSVESYYCACRPGYTGKKCEDQFVLEALPTLPAHRDTLDLQVPISIHLDHLHNVYIAAGTLACALIIVVLTVAACHCRVHETYKKCMFRIPWRCENMSPCGRLHHDHEPVDLCRSVKKVPLTDVEKEQTPSCGSSGRGSFSTRDARDLYYTLDFSDSQNAPLIQ